MSPRRDRRVDEDGRRRDAAVRTANAAIRAAHHALRLARGEDVPPDAADELDTIARAKGRADALAAIALFESGIARAEAALRFLERVRMIDREKDRYVAAYRIGAETLIDDLLGPGASGDEVSEEREQEE